jgi:hypothetical protein
MTKRYTFHRCQPHAKCPDLTGWYLEVQPGDHATAAALHRGAAYLYFARFGLDPHIKPGPSIGRTRSSVSEPTPTGRIVTRRAPTKSPLYNADGSVVGLETRAD